MVVARLEESVRKYNLVRAELKEEFRLRKDGDPIGDPALLYSGCRAVRMHNFIKEETVPMGSGKAIRKLVFRCSICGLERHYGTA